MKNTEKAIDLKEATTVFLFHGISHPEVEKALHCLNAHIITVDKDDCFFIDESSENRFAIVLQGRLHIVYENAEGDRSILTELLPDDVFGLSVSLSDQYDNCFFIAEESSRILIINTERLMTACKNNCDTHKNIFFNLIQMLSQTNMDLMRKLCHISQHSLRKKIISYLSEQSALQKSNDFHITLNRQKMADYLGADRSALSAELSRMKKEGLIDFCKNHFIIKTCLK